MKNKEMNRLRVGFRAVEDRVLIIETGLTHLATKSWVLGGVVGGMVLAFSLALAVVRLFS